MALGLTPEPLLDLARQAGFDLAGITPATPLPDAARFQSWADRGNAGAMSYLTDHRAALRNDVRTLLPTAQSVVSVAKLYNGPEPYSTAFTDPECAWIARYAWGDDYHRTLHAGLAQLAHALQSVYGPHDWKSCVDTAPVLERSLARDAGLGWIGKNTCLINQERGSWFFLGELLTSLPSAAQPAPLAEDRCGVCTRCIDACPTNAIIPSPEGRYEIDSRTCISYLTIELKGSVNESLRTLASNHVFGCDICQDVCPWNRRAATDPAQTPPSHALAPPLDRLAALTESEFRNLFQHTPVERARYRGFLRNVAIAMGNSGSPRLLEPLAKLATFPDPLVAEHAHWALRKLQAAAGC